MVRQETKPNLREVGAMQGQSMTGRMSVRRSQPVPNTQPSTQSAKSYKDSLSSLLSELGPRWVELKTAA